MTHPTNPSDIPATTGEGREAAVIKAAQEIPRTLATELSAMDHPLSARRVANLIEAVVAYEAESPAPHAVVEVAGVLACSDCGGQMEASHDGTHLICPRCSLESQLAEAKRERESTVKSILERQEELTRERDAANRDREAALKAGGFCDKHKPNGGTRNCLVCGCIRLGAAIDRIDYAIGEPNEMEISLYCTAQDEDAVVERVKAIRTERDRLVRENGSLKAEAQSREDAIRWAVKASEAKQDER